MNKAIKRSLPTDTPFARLPFGGLTSNVLRVIAVMLMVTDHIWATYMSFGNWMTYLGRLAFPIFAFQLAEGFLHTSDVKRYAKRLFLFALVSEIPFDLFCVSTWLNPFHQNVMFTLLLGLFAIMTIDNAKKNRKPKNIVVSILLLGAIFVAAYFGFVDYGIWGVATVLVFYLLRDFPFAWIAQLVSMVVIHVFLFEGQVFSLELFGRTFEISTQGFAVFSLVPIWLYNGKKGRPSKVMQYGSYAFYPVHMIVLYLIKHFA